MATGKVVSPLPNFLETKFDYVIVGAGTAGLVLASRLTENTNVTVGVIEAGKLRLDDANVASLAGHSAMLNNTDYDWSYKTVPQTHNANKVHHLARGKMVGGSSGLNFMLYVRPTAEDIDSWGTQAPGWSWESLKPYFLKHETLFPDKPHAEDAQEKFHFEPELHGASGPVQTSCPPTPPFLDGLVSKALSEAAGISHHDQDFYGGHHLGSSQPASLSEATVSEIILEGTAGKTEAKGVKFFYGGTTHQVFAKEVILSAGSIQSPRLLELSGVGDPEILKAAGVACKVDLPEVGENLQEHPLACVSYELTKEPEHVMMDSIFTNPNLFQENLKRIEKTQDGPLAGLTGLAGWVSYASIASKGRLEKTLASVAATKAKQTKSHLRDQTDRLSRLLRDHQASNVFMVTVPAYCNFAVGFSDPGKFISGPPPGAGDCYTVLISPMYVMSRGSTHITASPETAVEASEEDKLPQPRIDLALLEHPAEVDVLAAALASADKAFRSKSLAGRVAGRVTPPPEIDLEDLEDVGAYLRENVMIFNHNLGTCAMGTVVDERLRVKGVEGLRVVDCSVIPDQISANSVATVYALAERAADLIKEDFVAS